MAVRAGWEKYGPHVWRGTFCGRTCFIIRHRKTRSRRRKNEFGIGSHRVHRTYVWFQASVRDGAMVVRLDVVHLGRLSDVMGACEWFARTGEGKIEYAREAAPEG